MAYQGGCHCGAVKFNVEGEQPVEAMSCNCSHCRAKGFLLAFVPASQFTLTAGEESLSTYFFNKHVLAHRFCSVCGTQPFAEGKMPDGTPTRAINLRCVPGIELEALRVKLWDGASR